jgi:hypothetical protein
MCRARLKDEFRLSDDVRGPEKDDVDLMIRRCSKVIANRRLPPFIHPGGFFLNADHTHSLEKAVGVGLRMSDRGGS